MEKIDQLAENYDCLKFNTLPEFLKRRVNALRKLQLDHIKLQQQYHQEIQELELKYDKLYSPLYEKRSQIVNGEHEPTDAECDIPKELLKDLNEEQENGVLDQPLLTPEEEKAISGQVKGLPGFWLGCLVSAFNFSDSIEPHDRKVLKHLRDIKLSYGEKEDDLVYTLEFIFDKNPYFTNEVLTKTYYMKKKPDEKDPFSYEGFEVYKSIGCDINWNPNKDVTTKTVTVKQKNKNDGRIREKEKKIERDSFFYFFKPPEMPAEPPKEGDIDEELSAIMGVDFELGEVVRQSIIPRAVLYYDGTLMDDDADESDDEDDEDEEGSDCDDDEDDSDEEVDSDDDEDSITKKNKVKK